MRKLTEQDLTNIIGMKRCGYTIEKARVKRGPYRDSDHYGFVLCKSIEGNYVTWQFHLDENEKPTVYWGHYFLKEYDKALLDFTTRDNDDPPGESQPPRLFNVTISEELRRSVTVSATSREEAEQIVNDDWSAGQHVLGADDFCRVAITAYEYDGGGADG